jgi:hypothetical protein
MNRRNFLTRAGTAVAGALGVLAAPGLLGAAEPKDKMRIHVVYSLHGEQQTQPDWPNKGFDFRPVMERTDAMLAKECKGLEFFSSMATGEAQAKQLLEQDTAAGNVDGYLVYQMNCWNRVVQTLAKTGKPVLYADFQFAGSGGFLVYTAAFRRSAAPNVGFVASSKPKHLVEAVKCFQKVKQGGTAADFVAATAEVRLKGTPGARHSAGKANPVLCLAANDCLARLKEKKILAVRDDKTSGPADAMMGVQVENVTFSELNEAWKQADKDETRTVADRWVKEARKVEGVSRETLEASAAMYLAEKALIKKHDASGISINCLGGFYGGHIHAYPCLGFYQLNSDGLIGGCECDIRSACTMEIGKTLSQGRPGYISDPVIDTSKRQIIYAHCVAHNKAFGPAGKPNPYEILTHSEDRQGASIRSLLPTGYMTTSLQIEPKRKEILFHQALAVANDPDDRACRTKLCAEPVGDIEKLFGMWDQWGWHRVTFYGDLKEPVFALADAAGWKVVEEA